MSIRSTLERQLLAAFLLLLIGTVIVTVTVSVAFTAAQSSGRAVTHTRDVIEGVRTLQNLERQWLLARTNDQREAFNRRWARVFADVQDNPAQQNRLQQWRDQLFLSAPTGTLPAQLQENEPLAQALITTEERLLTARQHEAQQRIHVARWIVLIGLPMIAVIGLLFTLRLIHRVRHFTGPLLSATERVQNGDLSVRLPVAGNDEFSAIATHFNAMTDALAQTQQNQAALRRTLESRVESLAAATTAELQHLSRLGTFIQACATQDEAAAVISSIAPILFPEGGSVALLAESRNLLEPYVHWSATPTLTPWLPSDCWASRLGGPHVATVENRAPRCTHDHTAGATLCVPLSAQGETLGVLTLYAPNHTALDEKQELARRFADRLSIALANLRLQETLRHQSVRDPLTGLFNRRYIEETGARELARAQRHGQPVSVLMLDVDDFKQFNDVHGHAVGDAVLRRLGGVLARQFREEDIACRYGGEEFLVLLPDCAADMAIERAEALRIIVSQLLVAAPDTEGLTVTVSVGVASTAQGAGTLTELINRADQALYAAKRAGRDCVKLFGDH